MRPPAADESSRVLRSKEEARSNYNRLSRWYDLVAGSETRFTDLGLRLLDIQTGERVLELGFGTGKSLAALARSVGTEGRVFGLDLSEGMRGVAARRLARAGLDRRVELHLGDAAALPYAADSFDAIFMGFTLELFDTPEIPVVLKECRRALRSGGRLAVVAMAKGRPGILVPAYEWAHVHFPILTDCRPIAAREFLQTCGLETVAVVEKSMWGLPVDILLAR
jgi:ubiquinone/menaquinone biosynthesis C-methylase UbiE